MNKIEIKKLLEFGYLLKELPPAFNSRLFAQSFNAIKESWDNKYSSLNKEDKKKFDESKCLNFSFPKGKMSRRILQVPNPLQFSKLCEVLSENWFEIENHYNSSPLSTSIPMIDSSDARAVKTKSPSLKDFKQKCTIISYNKIYLIKMDISNFYPSIYTHSIPWSLHTKAKAKRSIGKKHKSFEEDPDYFWSLCGNSIDERLRHCQSNQSVGIPVGPDTSLITSEIILCAIDKELVKECPFIKGYRYMDDYYIYVSNKTQADKVVKKFQTIIGGFRLNFNEAKTKILKFPFAFESDWATILSTFEFRKKEEEKEFDRRNNIVMQRTDINRYFSLVFQYANQHKEESVFQYATQIVKNLVKNRQIFKENWELFEALIFKSAICEPLILPDLLQILLPYKVYVTESRLKNFIIEIIETHISVGHNFEVSWALWYAKSFNIEISDELARTIFDSDDIISIIIALDLRTIGLINKLVDTSSLYVKLTADSFSDEEWLLIYESLKKGWLKSDTVNNLLSENAYFKILGEHGVEFYDSNSQVKSIKLEYQLNADVTTKIVNTAENTEIKEQHVEEEHIIVTDNKIPETKKESNNVVYLPSLLTML